ncbi:MAG: aminotransferase class I/II-fold pyridoxal phosphate-dependent enzyme [Gammaproteobacteria bacterium]
MRAPWIYQGSFSKSFAPGLRLGYLASSRDLLPDLVRLKQAADLHSNRISQWWVLQQLADPGRAARLAQLVASYRDRRDAFAASLNRHFGELAEWASPPGGLFFWLRLDPDLAVDTQALRAPALERGVAFMPGEPFYPEHHACANAMRLNFSHADPVAADRGLATLAALLRETAANGRAAVSA